MSLGHEAPPVVTWSRFLPRADTALPPHIRIIIIIVIQHPACCARALFEKKMYREREEVFAANGRILVQQSGITSERRVEY